MSTQNPNTVAHDGAEELSRLYTGLIIGGTALYEEGFDLWGKHAQAWGEASKFEISQGSVTGTFTRDDVEFEMGSQTAALRVAANVRTPERQQRLDLFLRGTEPAFSIRSLVELPAAN